MLSEHLLRYQNAELRLGHKVVDLGEEEGKAWVDVVFDGQSDGAEEVKKKMEADYVVGCDGANSRVRRSLFGDRNFPGWTWDEQIVATNVGFVL